MFVVVFGVRFLNVFAFVFGCVRCSVLGPVLLCSMFGSDVVLCSVFERGDDTS